MSWSQRGTQFKFFSTEITSSLLLLPNFFWIGNVKMVSYDL